MSFIDRANKETAKFKIAEHEALDTGVHGVGSDYVAGLASGSGEEASQFQWAPTSYIVVSQSGINTVSYTDCDVSAYTSSSAKLALLRINLLVNTIGADHWTLFCRKNGDVNPTVRFAIDQGQATIGVTQYGFLIVALDDDQVFEWQSTSGGAWNVDLQIITVGWIE